MFVLGIDPGLSRCGYGLVGRGEDDSVLKARAAGVIETDPHAPLPQRLLILHTELRDLVAEFTPDVVAVERVFFQVNVKTAMSVGQASGLALVVAAEAGCAIEQYTANEVKQALVGYGAATKDQVQRMVANVLGLAVPPNPPDAADALALAVCHLTTVSVTACHGSSAGPTGEPGVIGGRSVTGGSGMVPEIESIESIEKRQNPARRGPSTKEGLQ